MSKDISSEKDAINQLYATIKTKFEQDGVLQEIRCLLNMNMITLMKGKSETNSLLQGSYTSVAVGDVRMKLLNQLIMEYFHWHGYHYSAQMFSMESSCDNVTPMRQCLEGVLGNFHHKDLPILLEVIATLLEKNNK